MMKQVVLGVGVEMTAVEMMVHHRDHLLEHVEMTDLMS